MTTVNMEPARLVKVLQGKVDASIRQLGGYWRPLSALARLMEELAELAELLQDEDFDREEMGGELADIFVISTCLANQYCAKLHEEYVQLGHSSETNVLFDTMEPEKSAAVALMKLVAQAGQVARILNHYEGDKKKKPTEKEQRLALEIARLHIALTALGKTIDIQLFDYVEAVLNKSLSRDKGRFGISHDPTTEPALDRFKEISSRTGCFFAAEATVWGSYEWDEDKSIEENIDSSLPSLMRFTKCSEAERLDGFVLEVRGADLGATMDDLSRTFTRVLKYLSAKDPAGVHCMDQKIDEPGWQFSYNGQRFFITTFAPVYAENHPRCSHNENSVFIFLQPEFSFDHHGVHRNNPKRHLIKKAIRKNFADKNMPYDAGLVEQPLEVYKYIKPLEMGGAQIRWWEVR